MATRTISNAGGLWSATTAWVEGAVPTAADDVVATATSGDLHHNVSTQACRSIDFTNYVGTFTFDSGQGPLLVGDASGGDVKLVAGMTIVHNATGGGFKFVAATGGIVKLTSAGKSVGALVVNVGATTTVQLQDDIASMTTSVPQTLQLASGKFDTQGFDITTAGVVASGGFTTITLGDSIITCSNAANNSVWVSVSSAVYPSNTATIVCSAASVFLNPAASNYNGTTFKFTGGGTVTMNGGSTTTGANVLVEASAPQTTLKFSVGATAGWTIANLSVTGTSGAHHSMITGTAGTQSGVVVTGTVSVSYCDIIDLLVTGASAPIPMGVGTVDNGNNQGIKFATPYVAQMKKLGVITTATNAQLLPLNVTAGNTILVAIEAVSHPVSTVVDSLGNTYTPIWQKTGPIGELWYCPNVLGGADTVTVTVTGTDNGIGVILMEIGSVTAAPLDQSVVASGTSTSPSSGASSTTTVANEMVVGWVAAALTASNATVGAGYKNLMVANAATGAANGLEQVTVTSTGAQTATFGLPSSVAWHCGVVTFKIASGSNVTGASSMGITVGRTTAGVRTRLGSITYALVLARTTAGVLTAKGASTLPLVLSRVTAGTVAGGQALRPDADLAAGDWVTAPLWSKVEEAVADGVVISAVSS